MRPDPTQPTASWKISTQPELCCSTKIYYLQYVYWLSRWINSHRAASVALIAADTTRPLASCESYCLVPIKLRMLAADQSIVRRQLASLHVSLDLITQKYRGERKQRDWRAEVERERKKRDRAAPRSQIIKWTLHALHRTISCRITWPYDVTTDRVRRW